MRRIARETVRRSLLSQEKRMMRNIYSWLMKIGKSSGCHQMPERSLKFKGYQCPVCARCTGVFIGNVFAIVGVFIFTPHWKYLLYGCGIMLADWLFQYFQIMQSTNIRRIITGIIGGYSLTSLFFSIIMLVVKIIIKIFL